MRTFPFTQIDVFSSQPLQGNPLAVFPDARGLSDGEMQAIAREMNLSETTFILPRDAATEAREGISTRIFTVEEELPFAGHPTLGTAFYLHSSNPEKPARVTLDLQVGKIPVEFSQTRADAGAIFGEMRQRDPEFGPTFAREDVARAIGIAADELDDRWPIQSVSTGVAFTVVPFRHPETLRNLKFAFHQAADWLERSGAKFLYFVCPRREGGALTLKARMIFYNGEDPATGSAAGCCAAWLVRHGVAKPEEQVLIEQGEAVRRPSKIYVRASESGAQVNGVRVGGHCVEILRGELGF
jgi:trans-2,3-dihydro-3-hydroxyanthranilate isomerase